MRKLATWTCALALCAALPAGALAAPANETEMDTDNFVPVVDAGTSDGTDGSDASSTSDTQDGGSNVSKEDIEKWQQEEAAKLTANDSANAADNGSNETELSTEATDAASDVDGQSAADGSSDDGGSTAEATDAPAGTDDTKTIGATSSDNKTDANKDAADKKKDDKKASASPEANSFLFLLFGCLAVAIVAAVVFFTRSKGNDEGDQDDPWQDEYDNNEWGDDDPNNRKDNPYIELE